MKIKTGILLLMTISVAIGIWGCSKPTQAPVPTESEMPTEASTEAPTEGALPVEPTEVKDPKIIEAIVQMDNSYTESLFKGDFERAMSYFYRQDDTTADNLKNTIDYFTKGKISAYKTLDAVDVMAYEIDGKTFYLYKLEVEYVLDGVTATDITKEDSCAILNGAGQMLRVIKKDTGITADLLDSDCVVSKELAIDGLTIGAYVDQSILHLTGTNLTSGSIVPEGDKNWTRYSVELFGGEVHDFNGYFDFSALDKPLTYTTIIRNTYGNDISFENIHDMIDFIYVRDVEVNGAVKDLLLYSAGDSQAKFDQKQLELMNE